jgi:hypothetical protein
MSGMSNFDDFAKQQLENYTPQVPEHVWENIAAKRDRKKRFPFFIIFFNRKALVLAATLLALIAGGYLLLPTTTKDKFNAGQHQPGHKVNAKEDEGNKMKGTKELITDKADSISEKATIKTIENNAVGLNKTANTSTYNRNNVVTKTRSHKHAKTIGAGNGNHLYTKNKRTISVSEAEAEEYIEEQNNGTDELNVTSSLLLYSPEKITAGDFEKTSLNKTVVQNLRCDPCPTIEKNAAGNKYYIEVYAGPDYASKNYSDTSNSALLQKRKGSTSFRSAFSAGLRYTRVFDNGVSVKAGLNYSQINEKFSFVQSNIVQLTYIIDPATGDTTGTFLQTGTRYKTTNNTYHTFDVPLLLGFEIGNGRLHANFNAGAVVNIYSWQKGESLDTSFKPVNISTGKSESLYQYKTNIGVGFMGGVSLYYKLNDRFHLLAEPYFRYNFSPMNKEMLSLQEKFSTIGMRLGVRLDLH